MDKDILDKLKKQLEEDLNKNMALEEQVRESRAEEKTEEEIIKACMASNAYFQKHGKSKKILKPNKRN